MCHYLHEEKGNQVLRFSALESNKVKRWPELKKSRGYTTNCIGMLAK
jgi:hypothetical protein